MNQSIKLNWRLFNRGDYMYDRAQYELSMRNKKAAF